MRFTLTKCNIILLCTATICVILGLTLLAFVSTIYSYIVQSSLSLGSDTTVFKKWQKPTKPIIEDIYFFNWTNPQDIYNPSIKPKFIEVGPYRYIQYKEKTNITWNNENSTITYQYLKHYYFDEENSPCKESDVIATINIVALGVATKIQDWNLVLKKMLILSVFNAKTSISIQKSVKELLFSGYEDPILAAITKIPFVSYDKPSSFGWFYGRNGTIGTDGVFNMGISQDENFGALKQWNYKNGTKFYKKQCGRIDGSGGELYPRNVQPDTIRVFSPEICKTVRFNFEKNTTIKGVRSYKFSTGAELFDNGSLLPENVCYCNGRCRPSGVLNVASCRDDAPIFLSQPNFYFADSFYRNAVEGMNPDKEKHEFYVTLEPNTGVITDISARLQINALLQPIRGFKLFENVPEIIFPILWFDQKFVMADELAVKLKLLFNLPNIIKIISYCVIVAGLLFIVGVVVYIIYCKGKNVPELKLIKEAVPLAMVQAENRK